MNFRIILTGALLSMFFIGAYAQKTLENKLVEQACEHFDQESYNNLSPAELEEEMTNYFGMLFLSNMEEITEAAGGMDKIEPYMEKLGEDVAVRLMIDCPSFQKLALTFAMEDMDEEELRQEMSEEEPSESLMEGQLVEVTGDRFAMLAIKDLNGKTHQLLWGTHFPGAEALENPAKLRGKPIEVSYREEEYYHAGLKEYISTKVLTGLRVLE